MHDSKNTNNNIIVFFTLGVSLKIWSESGILTRELMIYQKLVKKGFKISFVTYGNKSDLSFNIGDINILPIFLSSNKKINKFWKVYYTLRFIFSYNEDLASGSLFMTHQMRGGILAVIFKYIYNVPLIIRCGHEWYRNQIRDTKFGVKKLFILAVGYFTELLCYGLADRVIISNESDQKFIKRIFPINQKKIILIRNYIDTVIFRPDKKKLQNQYFNNTVLYVGRIINRKNIDSVINALSNTKYSLHIIGDGPEKNRLKQLSKHKRVETTFLGLIQNNELASRINKYHVFVQPSFYENSPKTLLEAMACGIGIVATDVDGNNELIDHNQNGLLCSLSERSIYKNITKLMENIQLRQRLGNNSVKYIRENCSVNKITSSYNKIIQELIH